MLKLFRLTPRKAKKLHKFFSGVAIFSLFLQLGSGIFYARPVLAEEKLKSEITFDKNKNSFNLSVNTAEEVNYLLAYRTDSQTEVVQGTDKNEAGNFSKEIYAGTCSANGICLPHQVLRGILKIEVRSESWLTSKRFTIDSDNLNLIEESVASSLNLSDEENNWLINPNQSEVKKEYLTDQTIRDSVNEDWNIDDEKGIAETKEKVKIGIKYIFPLENKVSVTFKCLPEDESLRTSLKIQQIKISDLKLPDNINPATEYAYDITTDMQDGTFEYDITLPFPKKLNENATVKYAENVESLENIKEIEEEKNVDNDKITIKGLKHFTIFIIDDGDSGYADNGWKLYSSGGCGNNDHKWVQPSQTGKVASWTLPVSAPTGRYLIKVNWTTWTDHATNAHYQVYKDGSLIYTSGDINQKLKADGSSASNGICSGWYTLGSFDLSAGDYVEIGVEAVTNGNLVADSVMFLLAPTIIYPANGSYKTTATWDKVDWTDSAGTYPAFTYKYESYRDENYTVLAYSSGWLAASEIPTTGTSEGTYYLRVKAKDNQGNETDWSNGPTDPYKIIVDNTPPQTPTDLGFNTPPGDYATPRPGVEVACGGYVNQNSVSHHWSDESASGAVGYQRQWKYPGSSVWQGAENWNTPYTNYRTFGGSGGTEGLWYVRVRAKDAAGNWSDWSTGCAVTFDKTPPAAPDILFPNPEQYFNTAPILNDWTDVVDNSGIGYYRIEYEYDDGHSFSGMPYRMTTSSQRNHSPALSEQGGVKFRVQAFDNAGNEGGWSEWRHYYYDSTPPSKPLGLGIYKTHNPTGSNYLGCGGYTNDNKITVDWLANPEGDIDFYWFGTKFNPRHKKVYSPDTRYFANMTPGHNPYYYTVIAVDKAGNESPISDQCGLILDQDAPDVEITSPTGTVLFGIVPIRGTVLDENLWRYWLVIHNNLGVKVAGPGTVYEDNEFVDKHFFDWDTTTVPNGEYTIKLEARDKAGNKDSGSIDWMEVTVSNTGSISGIKFEDIDGNGQKDEGENGLEGWTIELREQMDSFPLEIATTSVNGNYYFEDIAIGSYYVCEVEQSGWLRIQPGDSNCQEVVVNPNEETTNVNFGNFQKVKIKGRKCEDPNGNGNFLAGHGEEDCIPLEGWQIELYTDLNGPAIATAFTDSNGVYEFNDLVPGKYYLKEILPGGWVQTRPQIPFNRDYHIVNVNESGKTYWRNFGNFELGEITACKYEDLNGDGELGGEPLMDGVLMTLYRQGEGWEQVGEPQATVEGCTTFTGLGQDDYQVEETVPPGYYNTTPTLSEIVTINSGDDETVNFLNTQYGQVLVCKYDDYNGNGILDDNEPGLNGVNINLRHLVADGQFNEISLDGVTGDGENEQGCYLFENLILGDYRVTEDTESEVLAGYLPSDGTETAYDVSLEESGQEVLANFFNELQPISLSLNKTHNKVGSTVSRSETLHFTLTVKNTAESTAYGVTVRDVLPDGFSYISGTGKVGGITSAPTISGQQLTWNVGDMAAGQEIIITYDVLVSDSQNEGGYANVAVAHGTNRPAGSDDNSTSFSNFAYVYSAVGIGVSYSVSIGGGFVLGAATGPAGEVLGAATGSPTILLITAILMILAGLIILLLKKGKKLHV